MHTGYSNHWMCSREQTVPNLQKNGGLRDGVQPTDHNQIQSERQRSNLSDFTSLQKFLTSQHSLNYLQKSSHYDWRKTFNHSSASYNYQNMGISMRQNDHRSYWQNLTQRHSENRNTDSQSLNYNNMYSSTYFSESQNSAARTARIRVRDVHSLNNIAQNSMQNYGAIDKSLNWHLVRTDGTGKGQQNRASKNSVDHRNFSSSALDANHFRASFQKPPRASKPSMYQERCANVYFNPREEIPGGLHNLHNINMRQNERPYRTSTSDSSTLQDLLGSINQMEISRSAEVLQNVQPMNSRLNFPPNATKDSDLSLPCKIENTYSLRQSTYRSRVPYSDILEVRKVPPTSKGNLLPHNEPTSSRIAEESAQSVESLIRVSAVMSLPEWCGGHTLNNMPIPNSENPNFMSGTNTNRTEDSEIFNNEPPCVISSDVPGDSLKVKEEPKMPLEFFRDDASDISIQDMKTEEFQEEQESEPENSERTSNENIRTSSSSTEKENNEDNLYKDKINAINQNSENKFTVGAETKNTQSEYLSSTREVRSAATESCYKSQINRDKLDLLIEFINGGDKHLDYISEQKSKKPKKMDDSINARTKKPSSEKIKISVRDKLSPIPNKVAGIDITRHSPQYLPTIEADDSAKKSKKEEHGKLKDVENLDKANPKNDTKKRNFTDYVCQDLKDIQDNQPRRTPEPKNKDVKWKPENNEYKSVTTENQTQVTVTKKNSESAEKSKKLKTDKEKTDANLKSETGETNLQDDKEKAGNFQPVDINLGEKPKVNQPAEVVKTQSKVSSDSVSSPEENELERKKDQAQEYASGKDKRKSGLVFSDMEYQLCDFCSTASRADCFWMNIVSGEIKCLHCFKRMNLDAVEATRKLPGDGNNQEVQTKKDSIENVRSPNRKNDSEDQTQEKDVNCLDKISTSDGKKSRRRHSTGSKGFRREKRKSLDEHGLDEEKMKRRKSDEKSFGKAKDQISEASKSSRKSFSMDTSPRKEELSRKNSSVHMKKDSSKDKNPISKLVSTTETNWEGSKKRMNSTEDLRPRKIEIIEETKKDRKGKFTRRSVETPENGKKYEKTKDSWSQMDRERHGYDKKSYPKKTTFSWEKNLNETHTAKIQCRKKSPARQKKQEKKRNSEVELTRSTKEDEGEKEAIKEKP